MTFSILDTMEVQHVPKIDWLTLKDDLKSYQSCDPEELVHELVHVYLCSGQEAFKFVGSQHVVADLIKAKYKTETGRNRTEIKTSAITFLVLQPLGQTDLNTVISNMHSNINYADPKEADQKFYSYIADKKLIRIAKKIHIHIVNNYEEKIITK